MVSGKIYLNVPYDEKESAKSIGAKWDSKLRKWYYDGEEDYYYKFAKWIACGLDEITIAHNYLYILEDIRICPKCKNNTRVVGLGIDQHTIIYCCDDGKYRSDSDFWQCDILEIYDEKQIPPVLLRYMKQNYNVYQEDDNFLNHCDHCGSKQGSYGYLFEEDSSGESYCKWEKDRFSNLKIYRIGIEEDLALDWEYDHLESIYFMYGKIEDLQLATKNNKNKNITYAELYDLI